MFNLRQLAAKPKITDQGTTFRIFYEFSEDLRRPALLARMYLVEENLLSHQRYRANYVSAGGAVARFLLSSLYVERNNSIPQFGERKC